MPFVQVGTYPTRNFATLGTVIVTAAVYRGFDSGLCLAADSPLNLPALAGITPYTSSCEFAECCVLVNSRYPCFTVTDFWLCAQAHHLPSAHLIPKLRCHLPSSLEGFSQTP